MSPPGPKCGLCIVAGCRYKFLLEAYLDCVSIHFQGQAARSAFPLFLLTLARRRRRSLRRRNGSRRAWVSPVVNNELGHRARPFGGSYHAACFQRWVSGYSPLSSLPLIRMTGSLGRAQTFRRFLGRGSEHVLASCGATRRHSEG